MSLDIQRELQRTQPDYVVYVPRSTDGSTFDNENQHLLVFDGPDGSLMAVWTQSSQWGTEDRHIMFTRSADDGVTWAAPTNIAGCRFPGDGYMARWAFPVTSRSGRTYVLYNQFHGLHDVLHFASTLDCVYSDDLGATWSRPGTVSLPRGPYEHPDPRYGHNIIVWQQPQRDRQGCWFTGYTHWISTAVRTPPHIDSWTAAECVVEFMRFENVDDDPSPQDIRITCSAWGEDALRVPHYSNPLLSIASEPSHVRLPDGRLFCTMRTMSGYMWYSLSSDDGYRWCSPRPLLRRDHGLPILQPLCCCPLYPLADGRFVLFHHNNDGRFQGCQPEDTNRNRRPSFAALGEFRPHAEQPVWFSRSKQFMDNDGVAFPPGRMVDTSSYPSFTTRKGDNVLWHCDRKFFLVGKRVSADFLADLDVPAS
jgi:hypothetical protein